MGALAAARYRDRPRFTTDADFLVEPTRGLDAAFESAGYEVRAVGDGDEPDMLLVRQGGDRIDLLLATVDYLRTALDRAEGGVVTVEDVIVQKLIAWRPRDRDDIASILDAGHALDDDYIGRWAAEWDVVDRWRQVQARRS
jgi:dsDNA-binding SOS-regulon protein